MQIRFLDSVITDDGVIGVNQVREFSDDEAAGFIAAGHAVRVVEAEEATAPVAPEVAVSRKPKGR